MIRMFQQTYSLLSSTSFYNNLDTLPLPNEGEYATITIQMMNNPPKSSDNLDSTTDNTIYPPPTDVETYLAANVMYGILSKYFNRMIRYGHDIISSPTIHTFKNGKSSVQIASFGISRTSIEMFEFLFSSVCKDFNAYNKRRELKCEIHSFH